MDQTCLVVHKSRRPQARLKDSHTVLHTLWVPVSASKFWRQDPWTTTLTAYLSKHVNGHAVVGQLFLRGILKLVV
jgi:hypothetical protein